jgi:hypothetical protein
MGEIPQELLDELLAGYEKPEDLVGPDGLLKQLFGRLAYPNRTGRSGRRPQPRGLSTPPWAIGAMVPNHQSSILRRCSRPLSKHPPPSEGGARWPRSIRSPWPSSVPAGDRCRRAASSAPPERTPGEPTRS